MYRQNQSQNTRFVATPSEEEGRLSDFALTYISQKNNKNWLLMLISDYCIKQREFQPTKSFVSPVTGYCCSKWSYFPLIIEKVALFEAVPFLSD